MQTVELVVVTGVDDGGHVGRVDDVDQAAEEPGRADAACECREHGCEGTRHGPRTSPEGPCLLWRWLVPAPLGALRLLRSERARSACRLRRGRWPSQVFALAVPVAVISRSLAVDLVEHGLDAGLEVTEQGLDALFDARDDGLDALADLTSEGLDAVADARDTAIGVGAGAFTRASTIARASCAVASSFAWAPAARSEACWAPRTPTPTAM